MRALVHLTPADARRVPWRNGRGVTAELAVWPRAASFERGDFDARISAASVGEAGPFSAFAGFDRVLVVTGGEGLVLDHGAAAPPATVRPLVPYAFAGDWPTSATLVAGPVTDFNVLVRRGRVRAEVCVLDLGGGDDGDRRAHEAFPVGEAFVHVLAGEVVVRIRGDAGGTGVCAPLVLARGDSLRIDGIALGDAAVLSRAPASPSAACVALVVRLTPVA